MKPTFPICLTLVTGLILALGPLTATASEHRGHVGTMLRVVQGGMTLDQAVEQVRQQYNGRIVSAETKISGNREVHYIKVLTEDGKVKTIRVPGRTLGNSG
jgi:aspartate-semialdehyde dehydrogenase